MSNNSKIFDANKDANLSSLRVKIPANQSSAVAGNKITFDIPKEIDYISLKECYIHFDLEVSNAGVNCIMMGEGGFNRLINRVRIYEKSTNKNLEMITDYNLWNVVVSSYTQTAGEKDRNSLLEGTPSDKHNLESDIMANPLFTPYNRQDANLAIPRVSNKVRCILKLKTGLFNNDIVYPNELCNIAVELLLETNKRSLQVIPQLNNATYTSTAVLAGAWNGPGNTGALKISNDVSKGIDAANNKLRGCPFGKDTFLTISSNGNTDEIQVTSVEVNGGEYQFNFTPSAPQNNHAQGSPVFISETRLATSTYTLSGIEIELNHIQTPLEWRQTLYSYISNDSFTYNFNAVEPVSISQNSGANSVLMYIQNNSLRCAGILTIPNSTGTADAYSNDNITGDYNANGIEDYAFFYNGTQTPNENVPVSKLQHNKFNQQHFEELLRGYESMGYEVKSFKDYKDNFCIARAFSIQGGTIQLLNRDLSLRVNMPSGQTLASNTTYHNYLMVAKQIRLSNKGVEIIE